MDTAYKVPMPFRKIDGNAEPAFVIYDGKYPLAPDTEVLDYSQWEQQPDGSRVLKHYPGVYTMEQIHDAGQWSRQAAFIDGEWRECYWTASSRVFGRKLVRYAGLKLDVVDPMCWFPEASLTWTKE